MTLLCRGSANEWYEALTCNLRSSKNVRMWFAQNVLFAQPGRFGEYLLECPSSEVRIKAVCNFEMLYLVLLSTKNVPNMGSVLVQLC